MRFGVAFTVLVCSLTSAASFAPVLSHVSTNPIGRQSPPRSRDYDASIIVLGPFSKPTPEWAPEELEVRSELYSLDISKTIYTSAVKAPKDAYFAFAEKGQAYAQISKRDILLQAIIGGCFVGFGCLLSLVVAGNIAGIGAQNPGLVKLIFGALFPVNLILVLTTGAQLFSGNTATASAAYYEGLIDKRDLARSLFMSLLGNIVGCGLLACASCYAGLLTGGTASLCQSLAVSKVSNSLGRTIVKAILCNWLVALAVFLACASNDMAGKIMSIWFPIFTFVAIGLEHSVANFFLLPAALLIKAPISLAQVIFKNLIPVIVGNFIAGSIVVAAAYSYQFGKLGAKARSAFQEKLAAKANNANRSS